jgi:TonB-linked SusC/RagA family outer membrane protein
MKFSAITIAVHKFARFPLSKIVLIMKLTMLILIIGLLQVSAKGFSQITLNENNAPVTKVLESIRKQSGYDFFYDKGELKGERVTIKVTNSSLDKTLSQCFMNIPFTYRVLDKNVVITPKLSPHRTVPDNIPDTVNVHGRVVDENNKPLPGATVILYFRNKDTHISYSTDANGKFEIASVVKSAVIKVSYTGYLTSKELKAASNMGDIRLEVSTNELDEVRAIAYGTDSRRFSVNATDVVTAKDIEDQPVTNFADALEGRVPGLAVTASSGVPGSQSTMQIRGQNTLKDQAGTAYSIAPYDQPLIIVDGVPFATQNNTINQISSSLAAQGENPNGDNSGLTALNAINPADIESISVLKDADATSIYGSQGSNGVILITTKKGKAGTNEFNLRVNSMVNAVAKPVEFLNTQQYLQMRKAAFQADGITPSSSPYDPGYAPDLTIFDQNRYTNWYNQLYVRTPVSTDIHAQLQGGSETTTFLVSAGYTHSDYNFPGDYADNRFTLHSALHSSSKNKKLTVDLGSDFAYDHNNTGFYTSAPDVLLPPNLPSLLSPSGNLVWNYKGVDLSQEQFYAGLKKSSGQGDYNYNENLTIAYKILPGLNISAMGGYNRNENNEIQLIPASSQSPEYGIPHGSSFFGTNINQSIIIVPQIDYKRTIGKGELSALLGGNYRKLLSNNTNQTGYNYTNDALLGTITAAGSVDDNDGSSVYKYSDVHGRLGYIYDQKYIISLTGNRDGSSNFGPGRQFGNFGSAALGWIFSEENFFQPLRSIFSYAKLSSNYGTTGSDAVKAYQFQPFWGTVYGTSPFQGTGPLFPSNTYNPNYSWSTMKSLGATIDVGLLNNRLLLKVNYYYNREGNQLTTYPLPNLTGFGSVVQNFGGVVQNKGWEFEASSTNIKSSNFSWTSVFNISANQNKLISFPDLANSSYASLYVIGQPTTVSYVYRYKDVNPTTGIFEFYTANGGTTSTPNSAVQGAGGDRVPISYNVPKFFGGFGNTFNYKHLSLVMFFQFSKMTAKNYLNALYGGLNGVPGFATNVPTQFLSGYWQNPGDHATLERLTTQYGDAYNAANDLINSTGVYSDDTYLRLKTLSFSYRLPDAFLKKLNIKSCSIFIKTENLLTFTDYKAGDPEQPGSFTLFPLQRTIQGGLSFNF